MIFPWLWKFFLNVHLDLRKAHSTWNLMDRNCFLVTACMGFLSPPRQSSYYDLAEPPVECFWLQNSFSLQLFVYGDWKC